MAASDEKLMDHQSNYSSRWGKHKSQPHGDARRNIRGSQSAGFIMWGPWMFVPIFVPVHNAVVEIFYRICTHFHLLVALERNPSMTKAIHSYSGQDGYLYQNFIHQIVIKTFQSPKLWTDWSTLPSLKAMPLLSCTLHNIFWTSRMEESIKILEMSSLQYCNVLRGGTPHAGFLGLVETEASSNTESLPADVDH